MTLGTASQRADAAPPPQLRLTARRSRLGRSRQRTANELAAIPPLHDGEHRMHASHDRPAAAAPNSRRVRRYGDPNLTPPMVTSTNLSLRNSVTLAGSSGTRMLPRAKIEPETRQRKKTGARVRRSCHARGRQARVLPTALPCAAIALARLEPTLRGASTVDDDQVTSEPAWAGDESSSAPRHRGAARPRPRRFRRVVGRFAGWRVYLLAVMSV